jgi:hypothetical protein
MYALVMKDCDTIYLSENIDTLLAQYTNKDVRAVPVDNVYEIYTKSKYKDRFALTGDYILTAMVI